MSYREVVTLLTHKEAFSPQAQAAGFPLRRHPGDRYLMRADRIAENAALGLVWDPEAHPVDWWGAPRRVLCAEPQGRAAPLYREPSEGALRIVQGVGYDPGSSVYRLHSAINECSKHASALVRWGRSNPHSQLRQYDGDEDVDQARRLVYEADVVHCHVNYILVGNTGMPPRGLVIRHYHGSRTGGRTWMEPEVDRLMRAVIVGARLSHLDENPEAQWLPIAVPCARYAALAREPRPSGEFRVAHSPTNRALKNSDDFERACARLRQRGVPIRPVLIEGMEHGPALALKAHCDAVFDSFWLGIQGSGLEGGAMGLPVIAGDPRVRELYQEHVGYVPYSYANDEDELTAQLERLATDAAYRQAEAARVEGYVRQYHDYPAVARRYEEILAAALGREEIRTAIEPPKRRRRAEAVA